MIVHAGLLYGFHDLGIIRGRIPVGVMTYEKITGSVGVTVVICIYIIDHQLNVVVYVIVNSGCIVLGGTSLDGIKVEVHVIVPGQKFNISPFAAPERTQEQAAARVVMMVPAKEKYSGLGIPAVEMQLRNRSRGSESGRVRFMTLWMYSAWKRQPLK